MEQGVLDVIKLKYWSFIPRRGSGRRREERDRRPTSRRGRSSRGGEGEALTEDELTALFAETRPEVIEEMRAPPTSCAPSSPARPRDLRRQPQHQLHQHLRRRLRLLRLRPGQALARRLPRRSEEDFAARVQRGGRLRRDRDLHAGRDPPRLHARGLRRAGCACAKEVAPQRPPARLLADGDPLHVRALRAGRPRRSSTTCSSAASARRRGPRPRCSTTASGSGSRRTSCRSSAGSRSSRPPTAPGCARPRR